MAESSSIIGDVSQRFGKVIGYTYDGKFDADNVFCTAFFLCMNPDFIYRRQDDLPSIESLTDPSIIFYDFRTSEESLAIYNRNVNKEYRSDGIRYGTFGLVWRDFGPYIILPWDDTEDAQNMVRFLIDQFDYDIIEPMDSARIYETDHDIRDFVNRFNLIENEGTVFDRTNLRQYKQAVQFTFDYLLRTIERYKMTSNAIVRIYHTYLSQSEDTPGILYMDDAFTIDTDWLLDFLREHMEGIFYVVRPSSLAGYNIYPVKRSVDDLNEEFPGYQSDEELEFKVFKAPLPTEWYNKTPEELDAGWSGLYYCQPNGYRASTFTKDQAIRICKQLIYAYTNSNKTAETITDEDGTGLGG